MIDAYEIGITLALQNGVSEGLAAIRRDLGALDQAIAATAQGLARLQAVASGTVAGSEVESRRLAAAAVMRQPSNLGGPGPAVETTTPARAAARIVEREIAPPVRVGADAPVRPISAQTVAPVSAGSAPLIASAVSAPVAAPIVEASRAVAAPVSLELPRGERAVAPELRTAAPAATHSVPRPPSTVVVVPPAAPVAAALPVAPSGLQLASRLTQPALVPPPVAPLPPPALDLAAFARGMSPVVRGEVMPLAGAPSQPVATRSGDPRGETVERPAAPVAKAEAWQEASRRSVAPVADTSRGRVAEQVAIGTTPDRARTESQHQKPANGPTHGDVFLDGALVGRWMADRMTRDADRPPSGPTGFDARRSAAWPGATVGP